MQPPHEPSSPPPTPTTPTSPTSPTWLPPQMPTLPGRLGAQGAQQMSGLWQRYRGMSRNVQVLIAVGASVVLLMCSCCACGVFASALNGGKSTASSTATTGSSGQVAHQGGGTPVATATQLAPTATPVPTAPATPKPRPTATPKPSCAYPAVNGNPWCYTFTNTGKVIYNPPGGFCGYFNCISSFWNGSGYVMQCQDGMYSKSGGRTGSCSRHGGDKRPLYAP